MDIDTIILETIDLKGETLTIDDVVRSVQSASKLKDALGGFDDLRYLYNMGETPFMGDVTPVGVNPDGRPITQSAVMRSLVFWEVTYVGKFEGDTLDIDSVNLKVIPLGVNGEPLKVESVAKNIKNAAKFKREGGFDYVRSLYEDMKGVEFRKTNELINGFEKSKLFRAIVFELVSSVGETKVKRLDVYTGEDITDHLDSPRTLDSVLDNLKIQSELEEQGAFDNIREVYGLEEIPYRGDGQWSPFLRQKTADIADRIGIESDDFWKVTAEYIVVLNHVVVIIRTLEANSQYTEAVNYFHRYGIPYGDLSLNLREPQQFDIEKVEEYLFKLAGSIRDDFYEDARSYFEMIFKMYERWDEIEEQLGHRISFDPDKLGFEYRMLAGMVTVFIHDSYTFKNRHVNPFGVAQYAVSFVARGDSLEEVASRYSKDANLIADAVDILRISERIDLDSHTRGVTHQVRHFHQNGEEFYTSLQVYDDNPATGYLLEEVIRDDEYGYSLRSKYDYTIDKFFIEGPRSMPVYVAGAVKTFVETDDGRVPVLREVVENLVVRNDTKRIEQRVTSYAPKGFANVIYRTIGLYGGNIIEDKQGEVNGKGFVEDRYINYEYESAFLEASKIITTSTTYDWQGNFLSVSRLLSVEKNMFSIEITDLVNHIILKRQVDNLNKIHRVEKTILGDTAPLRDTRNYFTDPLLAGFGHAHHAETTDLITNLVVSTSKALAFNDRGGVDFYERNEITRIARIYVKDGKGRSLFIYSGKDVYAEGSGGSMYDLDGIRFYADSVSVLLYADRYYRARDIASETKRYAWDIRLQERRGLIDESAIMSLENELLISRSYNPNTNLEREVFLDISRDLVRGIRISTKQGMEEQTTTFYNSLDIEMRRETVNARCDIVVETFTLDDNGRPIDEEGRRIYKYLYAEQRVVGTGVELITKIQAWNGYDEEVKASTEAGTERTIAEYNELEVIRRLVTKDSRGNVIFITTSELDEQGRVSEPYRYEKLSKAVQYNPNTGLETIIITESATGLIYE